MTVGGRKDKEGEQERQRAQRIVAKERALMNMKRLVYRVIQLSWSHVQQTGGICIWRNVISL